MRDAHRYEWQRAVVEALVGDGDDDVILVETGLARWQPEAPTAYAATFGAARVSVLALVERLYSDPATRGGAVR